MWDHMYFLKYWHSQRRIDVKQIINMEKIEKNANALTEKYVQNHIMPKMLSWLNIFKMLYPKKFLKK
jgi:hypothetical protein